MKTKPLFAHRVRAAIASFTAICPLAVSERLYNIRNTPDPLFSEPGWAMHTGAQIGIDDFQANRSPDARYRTTPLAGLFVREKGGFYHDGRFPTYRAVIDHYERPLGIRLSDEKKTALTEYLKSI
jgi:hypothetical protein